MEIKRTDLIKQLMEKHRYTKGAATAVIDDFTDIIIENLRNGSAVSIYGFGKFTALERAARSCPNPKTGERVSIPEHFVPKFYPSGTMKMAVKMWEDDTNRGLL